MLDPYRETMLEYLYTKERDAVVGGEEYTDVSLAIAPNNAKELFEESKTWKDFKKNYAESNPDSVDPYLEFTEEAFEEAFKYARKKVKLEEGTAEWQAQNEEFTS
jgi:hypothetical protein